MGTEKNIPKTNPNSTYHLLTLLTLTVAVEYWLTASLMFIGA